MDVKIKKKRTKQDIVLDILIYLFLAFVVIICVYPFWKNITGSSIMCRAISRLLMTPSDDRNVRKIFAAITHEIKYGR